MEWGGVDIAVEMEGTGEKEEAGRKNDEMLKSFS